MRLAVQSDQAQHEHKIAKASLKEVPSSSVPQLLLEIVYRKKDSTDREQAYRQLAETQKALT